MVSFSRWKFLFASVAKPASSSRQSAYRRARASRCTAAWTTSRSALRKSLECSRASPFCLTAASTISRSPFSASAANWRAHPYRCTAVKTTSWSLCQTSSASRTSRRNSYGRLFTAFKTNSRLFMVGH
eukprot:3807368-Amphidinium_carterae.1